MLSDSLKEIGISVGRKRDRTLRSDEIVSSRRNILLSTCMNGAVGNLVGGNFFTGFLLLLHADDSFIGLVTIIMLAGNLFQVLSPLLLERFSSRKRLLISIRICIHLFNIVLIGIIPYLGAADNIVLVIVIVIQLSISLANAISAPGFAIWHIKSIPEEMRARYFSLFTIINSIFFYVMILIASLIADRFKATGDALLGLLVLRIIAFILAGLDIYFLLKIKEYPNIQDSKETSLWSILQSLFKEKKYMRTVCISCLWSFTANIPGPFFSIYLLKDLSVSYSYINAISMLNIPILIFLTPFWAKRIQRTSWFGTLSILMGFYLISYLGLAFVSVNTLFLYPVFMIVAFVFASGINLTFANIPYINIPRNNQTRFIGFLLSMNSLSALIATALSRKFIISTAAIRFRLLGIEMQNKQYILLITAFLMLFAAIVIFYLRKNVEEGINDSRNNQE